MRKMYDNENTKSTENHKVSKNYEVHKFNIVVDVFVCFKHNSRLSIMENFILKNIISCGFVVFKLHFVIEVTFSLAKYLSSHKKSNF